MENNAYISSEEFWLKRALDKAQKVLAEGQIPLPENHYLERFMVEEVQDKIANEHKKNPGLAVSQQLSVISEGLICDLINQGLIFRNNASAVKSCIYDDYINRVDLLVQIITPEKSYYLALDVTYSHTINKKFLWLAREIKSGNLSSIKYGISSENKIPKFIIGLGIYNLQRLTLLWLNKADVLAQSILIGLLKSELLEQINCYAKYALECGQYEANETFTALRAQIITTTDCDTNNNYNVIWDKVYNSILNNAQSMNAATLI